MVSKNNFSEQDKQLYEESTGKKAIWKGKVTKSFRQWKIKEEVSVEDTDISADELKDMKEAIEEVKEMKEPIKEVSKSKEYRIEGKDETIRLGNKEHEILHAFYCTFGTNIGNTEIAEQMKITHQYAYKLTRRLREKGLLKKVVDEQNKNKVHFEIIYPKYNLTKL